MNFKVAVALVTLTVCFCTDSIVEACTCGLSHPQELYCTSDFVILARIKRKTTIESTQSIVYKVRVKKEFKISEKGIVALKSGRLNTAMWDSMCGVHLEVGELYVLSGQIHSLKAYVNLCGMNEKWQNLSKRQRKGLRLMYKHGCTCHVKNCFRNRCYRQKDSCNWRNICETKEGICHRQQNGSCLWNRNKALTTCNKIWRRNHTITEFDDIRKRFQEI